MRNKTVQTISRIGDCRRRRSRRRSRRRRTARTTIDMAPSTLDRATLYLFGQDSQCVYHQIQAIVYNLLSYLLLQLGLRTAADRLSPKHAILDGAAKKYSATAALVLSPGGLERLSLEPLPDNIATVGYNVQLCTRSQTAIRSSIWTCRIRPIVRSFASCRQASTMPT